MIVIVMISMLVQTSENRFVNFNILVIQLVELD